MTLRKDHQPKYRPYRERDKLLAFLLDSDAKNQTMADVLDLFAHELRTQATRIGQLIDPPLDIQKGDPSLEREVA